MYYDFYTGSEWGDAASYHVCINSSVFGLDGTVVFLQRVIEAWQEQQQAMRKDVK